MTQAMAQTMAQPTSFEARIARSDTLVATLARASDYAAGQAHSTVTLEHLLLALTEDADAARVLISNSVDLGRLRNDVASFLGQQPPTAAPGSHPTHDPDLTKILAYAEAAARQSPRPDVQIDGAIVLAAIVGDGKSMAATFLKAQGLTFQAAIRVIRQSAAAQAAPAPAPTEAPESQPAQAAPRPTPAEPAPPTPMADEARVGPRTPPIQRPLWEPMGFPNIRPDPPPRPPAPPAPARKAEAPSPASPPSPAPAREEERPPPPPAPQPPPSPEVAREAPPPSAPDRAAIGAPPPASAPKPAAAQPTRGEAEPHMRRPPPPPPGPPPLPSLDAGRRAPEGPPPIPQRGLGASRPPPPRPNLRLPQSGQAEPELTTPWPEATVERQPLPPVPPPYPPPPPPAARGAQTPDRARAREAPRGARNAPRPGTESGQLVENIPRRMKVGVLETVEIRIAREGVPDVARGLQGGGAAHAHQLLITRAMSVRLQGEPGRFYIEPKSPETQWTGARPDQLASDYAVWRFTVIPQVRGPAELTLIVASRSIGADGVVADTSLPEQRISIRVSANVTRGLKRWLGWIAVAILGGILAKLGEGFWEHLWLLARQALSI
ncbi:MAG TPA: Clp protease N-terminal domain-containing protein [Hyphomicrobiaceae bacterium]|nr:Clp protease N-terminal domain-containing protein [Hyphomicrobiaceae bacterium]